MKKIERQVRSPEGTLFQDLLIGLAFAPEGVVMAATEQPKLFLAAAEYRMSRYRERSQFEMALKKAEAEYSIELRHNAKASGERVTEGHIAEQVLVNKLLASRRETLAEVEEREEFAKLLLEAYRMRRECLRIVSDLVGAEIAMTKAVAAGSERAQELRRTIASKYRGAD